MVNRTREPAVDMPPAAAAATDTAGCIVGIVDNSGANSHKPALPAPSATPNPPPPAWNHLPADVLAHIAFLLPPDHVPRLLATCKSWHACTKARLDTLSPFYLPAPKLPPGAPPAFPHVTTIAAPLLRTRHHPAARYQAPVRSLRHLGRFPALATLDLSGQCVDLPCADAAALAPLRALHSLTLDECTVAPALLLDIVAPASRLTHLSLAGVRLPSDPPAHPPLLAAIGRLPRLCSLNLSARTALIQKHTASFASFQHTTTCLPLLHHATALAPLAPTLTALTLTSNRLAAADLPPLATLTRLASLALSLLLNDHSLALSTSALAALAPLAPTLTALTLRIHGTSREEGTLAHLPGLRSLTLTGCHNVILALSTAALTHLTHLDLSESGAAISHDLILHLASSLPDLRSLTLDRIRCTSDFELPADAITRGLLAAAPRLHALHLDGVPLHGTGLTAPPGPHPHPHRAAPFPHLTSLTVSAESLLRARYYDIALLTALRALTLTNYPRNELEAATRHGCLSPLTALTGLTALTLAPPSTRVHAATPTREPLLSFLAPLTALRTLSLGPISSHGHVFAYIAPLPHLATLHLTGCLAPSAAGVTKIASLPPMPSLATLHLGCLHWPAAQPTGKPAPSPAGPSTSAAADAAAPPLPSQLCAQLLRALPGLFPSLAYLAIGSLALATPHDLATPLAALTALRHLVLHPAPQMDAPRLLPPLDAIPHLQTVEVIRSSAASGEAGRGESSRGTATAWARHGAQLAPV